MKSTAFISGVKFHSFVIILWNNWSKRLLEASFFFLHFLHVSIYNSPFWSGILVILCNNKAIWSNLYIYSTHISTEKTHGSIIVTRCCSRVLMLGFQPEMCNVMKDLRPRLLHLDVATLAWAMRDRPTWDQHRVPLRTNITDLKPARSWHSAVIHWELRRRFYVCRDVPPDFSLLCCAGLDQVLSSLTNQAYCLSINLCDYRLIVPGVTD